MNPGISPWHSLRTRATAFTLAVFVLGIWALSSYATRLLYADMERVLGEQQFQTVTQMANQVNVELKERQDWLNQIAGKIDSQMMSNPAALQAYLEQRMVLLQMFNGGVWVAGLDGVAIGDVPQSAQGLGVNYMSVDFIAGVLKDGKSVISKPVIGKKRLSPVVAMAVAIRDEQGRVIGVMSGVTDLGKPNFLDKIAQNHYGQTGGYLLIAPQHQVIVTASDKTRIMQPVPAPGVNTMNDRYMQGFEGFGVAVSSRGVEELSAAKGIPVSGWFLVAAMPTTEAFAPVYAMQQRMLQATLLLTLLTGAMIWWILKRQLTPLMATADAMVALADSNQMAQPLTAGRPDEIGHLVKGFNRVLALWKEREAAMQDSQQNLATTLNSIGDAVIATNAAGVITGMNPTAESLTAWSLADAQGRPLTEVFRVVHALTRIPVASPVQLVMEQGGVIGLANHTVLLSRDGREYPIDNSAAPIRNAAGGITGVVLVFSDVTERYRLEDEMRIAATAFESQQGMTITDAQRVILRVNKAFTAITGYSAEEAVGQTPRILSSGRHDSAFTPP
jgi:PAS domain S-box-containing protein